jgi:hypothetical protein
MYTYLHLPLMSSVKNPDTDAQMNPLEINMSRYPELSGRKLSTMFAREIRVTSVKAANGTIHSRG